MSNLTKITDELWAVELPYNFENLKISKHHTRNLFYEEKGFLGISSVELVYSKYEILGTVSETEIDFDCESYVDLYITDHYDDYKDYTELNNCFSDEKYSFRSLLKSKGITPTPETKIVILKKI